MFGHSCYLDIMPKSKTYTITEAAKKLGVTRAAVHAAIREKRLKAKKGSFEVERVIKRKVKGWCIEERDLREYQVSAQHQDAGKKN